MKIGFTGKCGSGKTYFARYVSEKTGIPIIRLDYVAKEIFTRPGVRDWIFEAFGHVAPDEPAPGEDLKLFGAFRHSKRTQGFSEAEQKEFRDHFVIEIQKILDAHDKVILDHFDLPMIDVKLDKLILVKSNEEERIKGIAERDSLTFDRALELDKVVNLSTDYSRGNYAFIVENDYKSIPQEIENLVKELL